MEAVHRVEAYQCEECQFTALKREELKSHVQADHRDADSQCHKCDFKVVKKELKGHVEAVHWDENE